MEQEGMYLAAAYRYLRAVEVGSGHEGAREALLGIGPHLMAEVERRSSSAVLRGDYREVVDAVEDLLRIEERARVAGIAVVDGYAGERRVLFDRAARAVSAMAEEREAAFDWKQALELYDRAHRFEPDSTLAAWFQGKRARAVIRQGEDLLFRGRGSEAAASANEVLALDGLDPKLREEARRLQTDAGALLLYDQFGVPTLYLAVLPFGASDSLAPPLPPGYLASFNDSLRYAFWTPRPMLGHTGGTTPPDISGFNTVSLVGEDPLRVLSLARRPEFDLPADSIAEAVAAGMQLDVDVVVSGAIGGVEERLEVIDSLQSRRLRCRVVYQIVDVFEESILKTAAFGVEVETLETRGSRKPIPPDGVTPLPPAQAIDTRPADWLERELLARAAKRTRQIVFHDLVNIMTGSETAPTTER